MVEILFSSFLVRCWSTPDGDTRLLVEHVQSGERVVVPDIGSALGWLTTWVASPPHRPPGPGSGALGALSSPRDQREAPPPGTWPNRR